MENRKEKSTLQVKCSFVTLSDAIYIGQKLN